MPCVRVSVEDLTEERLDTGFYSPEFFHSKNILDASGLKYFPLGNVCEPWQFGAYALCNEIEWSSKDFGIPYLKAENLGSPLLEIEGLRYVTKNTHTLLAKSQLKSGDIIVATSGTIGPCAILPKSIPYANSNQDTIKFNPSPAGFDNYFVGAWFTSKYLQAFLRKEGGGAVQQHVYLFNFRRIPLLEIASPAQIYIGNKVRQAEWLRAQAQKLEEEVFSFHNALIPSQSGFNYARKSRMTPVAILSDRLDAHFYPAVVEDYMKSFNLEVHKLADLSELVTNGNTMGPSEDAANAIGQITVANLSSTFLKGEPRLVSAPSKREKFTKTHDILFCNAAHNKSYIGRQITYCHSEDDFLPSTEVMLIRLDRDKVPASYVRCYLLTKIGFIQIQSTIRGITAHSYPEDVRILRIPVPTLTGKEKTDWFKQDDKMDLAGGCFTHSTRLTTAAKLLVEALIDGHLTESDLIAAQKSLEAGDRTADREILSRLTRKGINVAGEPSLFPDLDKLYEALDTLETPEDEA
ncbi:MAG: restriction endonuclease subunit S [Deltaproteobacteria bacterium]|nr:restriction endonuclease subunit S [Deltaproteobacteria bacterium]